MAQLKKGTTIDGRDVMDELDSLITRIGNNDELDTTQKATLILAINEINSKANSNESTIDDLLSDLSEHKNKTAQSEDAPHGLNIGYRLADIIYFRESGTFNKGDYPWLRAIRVTVLGGGGAGGGARSTGLGEVSGGSGGGGGGTAIKFITADSLNSTETVTVGSGGTGINGDAGNRGGTSSFGSHCLAHGGDGGITRNASNPPEIISSINGGEAENGDLNIKGGVGHPPVLLQGRVVGGAGGDSLFGGGARAISQSSSQRLGDDSMQGAGGAGGASANNSSEVRGGHGGDGLVIVEVYA